VGGKVFVFLGIADDPLNLAMTVKLDESHEQALFVPGAAPTGSDAPAGSPSHSGTSRRRSTS
jgi:hypothetical protein